MDHFVWGAAAPGLRPEHFPPAFERAIAEQRREIDAIAANPAAPTFANTIEGTDDAGELLRKVSGVFMNLISAETNERLQSIDREIAPALAALRDDVKRRLREIIVGRTGMEDAMTLFKRFRGREPSVEPLLVKRGLKGTS